MKKMIFSCVLIALSTFAYAAGDPPVTLGQAQAQEELNYYRIQVDPILEAYHVPQDAFARNGVITGGAIPGWATSTISINLLGPNNYGAIIFLGTLHIVVEGPDPGTKTVAEVTFSPVPVPAFPGGGSVGNQ